ncbi:MAG: hypothetical protein ACK6C7_02670 [Pseudanabaena sp.]|nr:hypothetical protein [Pseudanabaena sp. 42896M_M3]
MTQLFMTYAKERAVGAIHELPLRQNEAFMAFLRKSYFFNYEQLLSYSLPIEELDVAALRAATLILGFIWLFLWWEGSINRKSSRQTLKMLNNLNSGVWI